MDPIDTPPSVNFHLWRPCNMACLGCFARFEDLDRRVLPRGHMDRDAALKVVALLSASFRKVTFAGGEPTLCPWLLDLIECAKTAGATTMLVTNGTRLNADYLRSLSAVLDWLTLSIDSGKPESHVAMGRAVRGTAVSNETYVAVADTARELGMRVKVNTVVNRLNADEDISALIRRVRPERWKMLQVLSISGQNDHEVGPLLVTPQEFEAFVGRHLHLQADGIEIVPEPNDVMTGTYAMVDPAGRFFDNVAGRHRYSRSILSVGVGAAWQDVAFDSAGFAGRGGNYSW